MKKLKSLVSIYLCVFFLITGSFFVPRPAAGAGISIDAGLTPSEGRLIFRTQMRQIKRDNFPSSPGREMKMNMYPFVLAYGARSDMMVMVRQAVMRREMNMMSQSSSVSGLADLFVMTKYRLVRINTRSNTLGIAPTIGIELPTGKKELSSNTYDLKFGLFASGRARSLGAELNVTYTWNSMGKTSDAAGDLGDEFSVEAAFANQFSFGPTATYAVAPVIELVYSNVTANEVDGARVANSGESMMLLSPGVKITRGSIILEGLVQIPVWQNQIGSQPERSTGFIIGLRLMN